MQRAELPPPPPPPPLAPLKLATQTSSERSPRSPAIARTLSDPKVLSEKKLSSKRDTLMTEDQKALEAVLATTSDIDARLERQKEVDKKVKQETSVTKMIRNAEEKAKQDARIEADRLVKQREAQELKDKKSSLVKGAVRDRKEHQTRSESIERIISPAEKRRVSKDLEEELFGTMANAPTMSPLFSNPTRVSSLDFVVGASPSPAPARPSRVSSLDVVAEAPAKPQVKRLAPLLSESQTMKIRRRPPRTEGGRTSQSVSRPDTSPSRPKPSQPNRSSSLNRPAGTPVGRHPLRTEAFYEPSLGEPGGAAEGSTPFI
jgi:hypothetical protein